jgi:very-short-patch-repair endonuclease
VHVPFAHYIVDAVAERSFCKLAVEIDGFAHQHATPQLVSTDYFRVRRLMYAGYVAVRLAATEAMANGPACWRSIFAITRAQPASRTWGLVWTPRGIERQRSTK